MVDMDRCLSSTPMVPSLSSSVARVGHDRMSVGVSDDDTKSIL